MHELEAFFNSSSMCLDKLRFSFDCMQAETSELKDDLKKVEVQVAQVGI